MAFLIFKNAQHRADIYNEAVVIMGAVDASAWLLTGNPAFGGVTPYGAIKAGRHVEVRARLDAIAVAAARGKAA
jgi:hypothetical protein